MTKIIAVASAKGGVGKTTTAINLGTALAKFGRHVIVVDGNLATPNIGIHLGAPVVPFSVHDAVRGKKDIKECVYSHESGVRIAPASISINDLKGIDHKKISKVLKGLEGTAELVIVDSCAGLGEEMFSCIDAADEILVVTTADLPSVTDSIKTIELAEGKGKTVIGVVLNRVRNDNSEMKAGEIEALVEKPVIASIPEDESIRKSLKKNHPVVYSHPDAPSSTAYKQLAALLVGQKYEVLTKKNA
ncbi:cell division ATPase MinD [Candidatus Woesearchaeota archaeon]|nr:cell division ATPase MinD [Candidatus Woesearchaeota archaeon]